MMVIVAQMLKSPVLVKAKSAELRRPNNNQRGNAALSGAVGMHE
jgi:hypothetical protein